MAMKFHMILLCVMILSSTNSVDSSCFSSLIIFGDSLSDVGNMLVKCRDYQPLPYGKPPYGISYFHKPTGRSSDGRLVIDFIEEYFGLPYIDGYFLSKDYRYGVNFAITGATVMKTEFFLERGYYDWETWGSLEVQMGFCKTWLASLPPKAANDLMRNSLIVFGEFGFDDYNHFLQIGSIDVARTFMRPVIDKMGSTIVELIELGAVSFLVPSTIPMGCSAIFLQIYDGKLNKEYYDPKTGCIIWLNDFLKEHNAMLQTELNRIQLLYPHTTITYGDLYNATMPIYDNPAKYGFVNTLVACCGGGGTYNYNETSLCGDSTLSICDDPSTYAAWDGYHLTDTASRIIANNLLEGLKTTPHFQCTSKSSS